MYLQSWISGEWLGRLRDRRSWTLWKISRTVMASHSCRETAHCLQRCLWHLRCTVWTWAWVASPSPPPPVSTASGVASTGEPQSGRSMTTCCNRFKNIWYISKVDQRCWAFSWVAPTPQWSMKTGAWARNSKHPACVIQKKTSSLYHIYTIGETGTVLVA